MHAHSIWAFVLVFLKNALTLLIVLWLQPSPGLIIVWSKRTVSKKRQFKMGSHNPIIMHACDFQLPSFMTPDSSKLSEGCRKICMGLFREIKSIVAELSPPNPRSHLWVDFVEMFGLWLPLLNRLLETVRFKQWYLEQDIAICSPYTNLRMWWLRFNDHPLYVHAVFK